LDAAAPAILRKARRAARVMEKNVWQQLSRDPYRVLRRIAAMTTLAEGREKVELGQAPGQRQFRVVVSRLKGDPGRRRAAPRPGHRSHPL